MFYNLGCNTKGYYTILDTDDNISELYSNKQLLHFKNIGVPLRSIQKRDIVLEAKGNEYRLKLFNTSGASYRGKFASRNNRGDLFDFRISLREICRYKDYLICVVICHCWCKYDIEVPMFMFDIVAFNVSNITNSFKCVFTSKPVYECVDMNDLAYMQGDCPDDCCVHSDFNITVNERGISVGDMFFNQIPYNLDVFKDIII